MRPPGINISLLPFNKPWFSLANFSQRGFARAAYGCFVSVCGNCPLTGADPGRPYPVPSEVARPSKGLVRFWIPSRDLHSSCHPRATSLASTWQLTRQGRCIQFAACAFRRAASALWLISIKACRTLPDRRSEIVSGNGRCLFRSCVIWLSSHMPLESRDRLSSGTAARLPIRAFKGTHAVLPKSPTRLNYSRPSSVPRHRRCRIFAGTSQD